MGAVRPARDRNRGHVDIYDIDSVTYWCEQFGCTKSQLRDAVREIRTSADALRPTFRGIADHDRMLHRRCDKANLPAAFKVPARLDRNAEHPQQRAGASRLGILAIEIRQ
jgi:hypothetical protein